MRQNPGERRQASRLLPETLAADPIIAATPQSDGAFAADVAWIVAALMLADPRRDGWSGEAEALPAAHPPDLRPAWRDEVAAALGSYGAIVHRNLTDRLGLAPGPNAVWPAGTLLPPAVR
jgi:hypothetical protein